MTILIETDEERQEFLENPEDLIDLAELILDCARKNIRCNITYDQVKSGYRLTIEGIYIEDRDDPSGHRLYQNLKELSLDSEYLMGLVVTNKHQASTDYIINPEDLDKGDLLG